MLHLGQLVLVVVYKEKYDLIINRITYSTIRNNRRKSVQKILCSKRKKERTSFIHDFYIFYASQYVDT